jgi:hypothetical protein
MWENSMGGAVFLRMPCTLLRIDAIWEVW